MNENKTIEAALVTAIENIAHKQFGLAMIVAVLIYKAGGPAWMLFGIAMAYIAASMLLKAWNDWLHRDDAPQAPEVVAG